ncbi:MAG: TetR/AcrR family transcriptional regulator [Phenylobacterium sp.]|nr:MAG: TetR/AcrR family transcriptional regulator [Phenylobacterium sp.]
MFRGSREILCSAARGAYLSQLSGYAGGGADEASQPHSAGGAMNEPASLKIKIRAGAYPRTADTVEQILRSTLKILMTDGYSALSIRRVAGDCGVAIGNLTYHFPNKAALLKELLEAVLEAYADRARQGA